MCFKDVEVPKNYSEFHAMIENRAELSVFLSSVMSSGFDPAPLVSPLAVLFSLLSICTVFLCSFCQRHTL